MMSDLAFIMFFVSVACLALAVVKVIQAQRQFKAYEVIEHVPISPEHPHLPDAAIEDEKPVAFRITDRKHLYLQPVGQAKLRIYMERYSRFLLLTHNLAAGLRLVATTDDMELQKKILEDWKRISFAKNVLKEQKRLLRDVFVRDPQMNPEHVKLREIMAMPWTRVLLLWQLGFDRNTNAVEDFTRSLTTSLSGRGNVKAGSGSPGSGSTSVPTGTPLFPSKCSGSADSPNATSESETCTTPTTTIDLEVKKP